jgi:hypothetical protein
MRIAMATGALLALLVGGLATPAHAEEEADDSQLLKCKKLPDKAKIRVTLAASSTLPELANWISAITCKNVVYSADVACRGATVVSPAAIAAGEAIDLFNACADAMGLKVTVRGNTLVITEARIVKCMTPAPAATDAKDPGAAAAPASPPSQRIDLDLNDLVKVDGARVEISRRLIEAFVADPDLLAGSMRIAPSFKDGRASGFKLYAIRPSSLPAKLGLMNGDTVSAIGGIALVTLDDALDAFNQLQSAQSVSVDLVRKGKAMTLEYKIR